MSACVCACMCVVCVCVTALGDSIIKKNYMFGILLSYPTTDELLEANGCSDEKLESIV